MAKHRADRLLIVKPIESYRKHIREALFNLCQLRIKFCYFGAQLGFIKFKDAPHVQRQEALDDIFDRTPDDYNPYVGIGFMNDAPNGAINCLG